MDCPFNYEDLARFTAGDLSESAAADIGRHVRSCETCRRRCEALEKADALLESPARICAPEGVAAEARRRLSRSVRNTPAPEVMTLAEVAEFLRIPVGEIEDAAPDLPAFEIAGRVRVRRDKLMEWIRERERLCARSSFESEIAEILSDEI